MKPPIFHRMFDYDRARLPNSHLASLEDGVRTIEEARGRSGATIGYPGWGVIYHLLLAHLDRNRQEIIIETGTNWGCTTIILAQALADSKCKGRVITFELDPNNVAIARKNIQAAGLEDFVELHVGNSHDLIAPTIKNVAPIRFAFLDASHLHDDVMIEFNLVSPSLADDALVLFDNTYPLADSGEDQRVNGALKTIQSQVGGNLINLEFVSWYTPGLAIWQKAPKL